MLSQEGSGHTKHHCRKASMDVILLGPCIAVWVKTKFVWEMEEEVIKGPHHSQAYQRRTENNMFVHLEFLPIAVVSSVALLLKSNFEMTELSITYFNDSMKAKPPSHIPFPRYFSSVEKRSRPISYRPPIEPLLQNRDQLIQPRDNQIRMLMFREVFVHRVHK